MPFDSLSNKLITAPNSVSSGDADTVAAHENAPKLLLVEDNKVALFTLENLIMQSGWHFISAMDGETALDLAQTQTFDLIITDLGLPGLSGIDLTHRVRAFEKDKHKTPIPIIGLTAHSEPEIKRTCLESGMNEVYTKPMTLDGLKKIKKTYFAVTNEAIMKQLQPSECLDLSQLNPEDSEEELFKLDEFALFDAQKALDAMGGDVNLLKNILTSIIDKETPADLLELEKAYQQGNWSCVEKLAHRMKSGFVYCGAIKLVHACQHIERYSKTGHTQLLNSLYQLLLRVIAETKNAVNIWLVRN